MKLELECGTSLCYIRFFRVNGIKADENDFGDQYDRSPETAENYGCGDMQFTRIPPKPEILEKYGISKAEYALIADQLENGLSFGCCGLCN